MKRFAYIDALRGYAVLGVIAVHAFSAAPIAPGFLSALFEQGARGVQLFYVASAFTLTISWYSRQDGAAPFWVRRLFRIVPMYWGAIVVYLAFAGHAGEGLWAPDDLSTAQIVATATFSAVIYPFAGSTVVPGGWTVTTEVGFYMLLPLLIFLIRGSWIIVLIVLAATIWLAMRTYPSSISFLGHFGGDAGLIANFAYFWLPNQLPVFTTGIAAYLISREFSPTRGCLNVLFVSALIALFTIPFTPQLLSNHIEYGLTFGILIFCLSKGGGNFVVRPLICTFGKISYSAYLLHFLIFNLLYLLKAAGYDPFRLAVEDSLLRLLCLMVFVAIATGGLSLLTYRLIETPMIKLGQRVVLRHFTARDLSSSANVN